MPLARSSSLICEEVQTLNQAKSTTAETGSALRSSASGRILQPVTVILRDVTLHAEQIIVALMLIAPLIYAKSSSLFINSPLCAVKRETLAKG